MDSKARIYEFSTNKKNFQQVRGGKKEEPLSTLKSAH